MAPTGTTTLTDAQAMSVTLDGVDLWVGVGGTLDNTGNNDVNVPATFSDDAVGNGDIGFRGTVTQLSFATVKDTKGTPAVLTDDVSYLGLEVSGLTASLLGLEDILVFNAWDIAVQVNSATDADANPATTAAKLDWSGFVVTDGIALPVFTMDDSVDLHADGNVALNLLDGVVVAKSGFDLTLGQVSAPTAPRR